MLIRNALRALGILLLLAIFAIAFYGANIWRGMHASARVSGTLAASGAIAPVRIFRDARGVPHIRAENEHDLFLAEGYAEASDRLFQMDLLRRYVYGRLSEVLGSATVRADEAARVVPVKQLVDEQWQRMNAHDRALLQAFADGVNLAMTHESTPVEFRILLYKPHPWRPQDTLAVGFATVLDLVDSWNDVASRVGRTYPLSDPCFDAPVTDGLAKIADPAHCATRAALLDELRDRRPPIGSNEWAAGGDRTTTGRALLANDPHLRLQIPGVWYLADLKAPGYHAAGAILAGTPGITLGHNDRLAWAATNGTVTALSVFDAPPHLNAKDWKSETIRVRFGHSVVKRYYRGKREFGAAVDVEGAPRFVLVRWNAYSDPVSPILTFDALDRAQSIPAAIAALRRYPGPTQNFALADTSGRAAYYLAGKIPDDPLWGRNIHPASDLVKRYPAIPFDRLPHVAASRDAVVWTSNNKMYGPTYPLRLSAQFAPPYRAYRVAQLLRARKKYDVAYFAHMQMDTLSVGERQLARMIVAASAHDPLPAPQARDLRLLAHWNGRFTPDSVAATVAFNAREQLLRDERAGFGTSLVAARRTLPAPAQLLATSDDPKPWGEAGAVRVKHPLAALGLSFLDGTRFAGDGDSFTVHVLTDGFSQSFHAVWDVGNWDAGGITIPEGESGEPGSGHYTDEAKAWVAGKLLPLPFSDAAVKAATVETLTLTP